MHLIIYGPEGSGKGTQAKLIAQKFSLPIITSGDLVRQTAKNDTGHLGDICREALEKGVYVDDRGMFALWRVKLQSDEAGKGFILDGFPRNLNQANFLESVIGEGGYKIDKVIYLKLSDEVAYLRLIKRNRKLYEGSSQLHDSPQRVKNRLKVYRKAEQQLLALFKKEKILVEIDADKDAEDVYKEIEMKLKN